MGNLFSFYKQQETHANSGEITQEIIPFSVTNHTPFANGDSRVNPNNQLDINSNDCEGESLTSKYIINKYENSCSSPTSLNLNDVQNLPVHYKSEANHEIALSNDLEYYENQAKQYSTCTNVATTVAVAVAASSLNFVTTSADMTHMTKNIMSQVHFAQDQCVEENSTLAPLADSIHTIQRVTTYGQMTKNNNKFDCSQLDIASPITTTTTIPTTTIASATGTVNTGTSTITTIAMETTLFSDKNMNIINLIEQPVTHVKAPTLLSSINVPKNIMRIKNDAEEHNSNDVINDACDLSDLCHHSPVIHHHRSNVCDTFTLAVEFDSTPLSNINCERNISSLHPIDLTEISHKFNDVNVTPSDVSNNYKSNCFDGVCDVDKLSSFTTKHNINVHQQLHKVLQSLQTKGNRSLIAKNIIEHDVWTNECNCVCKRSVSDSELNKICVTSREIDLIVDNNLKFSIDLQGTNEMKLDMKSTGQGVTLLNNIRRSDDKIETSVPNLKGIANSTRPVTLKNFRNSAIDIPRYESNSLAHNNARNVNSNRTLNNNCNVNLNRPLSNIYNVDSRHTLGNATNADSKHTLNNANDNLRNILNEDANCALNNVTRTLSIDTALDTVMTEKARLKRQRRFRSQDEPDDPIERLNRLKARISGALSEVKGVLKQYSVDNEDIECPGANDANNKTIKDVKVAETSEIQSRGPIQFRFIRKIHSRSSFAEEDDEEDDKVMPKSFQDLDASKIKVERKSKLNKTSEQLKNLKGKTTIDKSNLLNSIQNDSPPKSNTESVASNQLDSKLQVKANQIIVENSDISDNKKTLKVKLNDIKAKGKFSEGITKISENVTSMKMNENDTTAKNNGETSENKTKVECKNEQFSNATLKVPATEISSQTFTQNTNENITTVKPESSVQKTLCTVKETAVIANDNKSEANVKDKIVNKDDGIPEAVNTEHIKKPKKKVTSKNKEPDRRASVSCVDSSKLSTLSVPAQIKRRPSDSEAIIKKKTNNIIKTTTSGLLEEVTSQVKNSVAKKTNASAAQEANKKSVFTMKHVNNLNVNESIVNVKASRTLNGHSNDILIPTKSTIAASIENNTELMPKQIPINETFNDRTIVVTEEPLMATTATVKSSNETTYKDTPKMAINQRENNTEIKKCSIKADVATRQGKTNDLQEMSNNLHDLLNDKDAAIEKNHKKFTDRTESSINENEKQRENKQLQIVSNDVKTACQTEQEQKQLDVEKSMRKHIDDDNDEQVKTIAAIKVDDIANDTNNGIKAAKLNNALQQTQTNTAIFNSKVDSVITNGYSTNTNQQITNIDYCPPAVINSCEKNIQQDTTNDQFQKKIIIETLQATATKTSEANTSTNHNSTLLLDHVSTVNTHNKEMPEQQIAPVPVQTTDILIADPNDHRDEVNEKVSLASRKCDNENDELTIQDNTLGLIINENVEATNLHEAETVADTGPVMAPNEPIKPKKERKIKKKVIIKRQKRRLSVVDTFFQNRSVDETTTAAISSDTETLEKPIAFVTDDEDDKCTNDIPELVKKPLKSCMKVKEYEIGDEVLYPERFKKTQVRWKRGKIKERITSISYLIDIDGKEVSSHVNYLKSYTNRKVKFSGKEYLEIDYEQLAEEEEKAEVLRKRAQSIWNMV